jgi:uncharacterized protein
MNQSLPSFHFTQRLGLTRIPGMLLILSVSVLATSFLSGIFGMAGGMILMGILIALMPVEKAMVIHAVAQFASNGWRAVMWRRKIRWPVLYRYAIGALLASGLLLVLDITLSRAMVMIVLGLTPFLVLLLPARLELNVDRPLHAVGCGALSMGVQLISGVSGPLLDSFFVRSHMDRHQVVATKAAVQTFGHANRIVLFATLLARTNDPTEWTLAILLMVSAIVGTSVSTLVLDRLTDTSFRNITRKLVLAIGSCYLGAGLWTLATGA